MLNKASKKIKESESTLLEIAQIQTELRCYHCGSDNYTKKGKSSNGKQQYKCGNCSRHFYEGRNYAQSLPLSDDVWLAEDLGLRVPKHRREKKFIFLNIHPSWLRENAKKMIRYLAATGKQFNTLLNYLKSLNDFSFFLLKKHPYLKSIEEINRSLILDYLDDLSIRKIGYSSKMDRLGTLRVLFEVGLINKWFDLPPHLIRSEDYPSKTISLPRYIPEEVIQQLNEHLDDLPEPVMRMVLLIQECGLRVGELCQLNFDCLRQDSRGDWYIQFMRWKMLEEDTIPISVELALVIQEQQQYIRENLESHYNYLFCGRNQNPYKAFVPKTKVMSATAFTNYLKGLAEKFNIRDNSGKCWNFESHQFRHTVGTRMINNGVPQHIIQRYLGHKTPTMTQVYAHIHDETLRKEIDKYHETRVVNFQGETAELEKTVLASGDDLEWFKKKVQARALEHGYCARPTMLGDCDIPGFDGCYNCPHWRTNKNFLPVLKDTLERTDNVLNKARNCGWELQLKKNEPVKANLEKVIKSLEEAS
jgi:integrase/DNA-directed RNA polymerase subunit RPC12/RpoP